ncbi:MAG: SiaB family protein kinase [Desulfovibrio sp.]
MHNMYEILDREKIVLYFNGPVSQSVVEGLSELAHSKLVVEANGLGSARKIFSILVEQMQNIARYSVDRCDQKDTKIAHGQVLVGRDEDGRFYVSCGNPIFSSDAPRLRGQIEMLQSMSAQDLKELYRTQRRKGPDQYSCGAGLGFIDMARKSAKPLDYHIQPLDDQKSFFSLKVVA